MSQSALTTSLSDPIAPSPIGAAVLWVQGLLLGEVATVLAIIAVAGVGAMMLAGRVDLRRGITVVLGCFVLFGAATIAAGIRAAIDVADGGRVEPIAMLPPVVTAPPKLPPKPAYDPYAGASVFVGPH